VRGCPQLEVDKLAVLAEAAAPEEVSAAAAPRIFFNPALVTGRCGAGNSS